MAKKVKVSDLVQQFHLEIICGEAGLKRQIQVSDLYRPGLEMAGYFDHHPLERIQILGKTELDFFEKLSASERRERARKLSNVETPCLVVCRGLKVPIEFREEASKRDMPILVSTLTTTVLSSRLTGYLENSLARTTTIHGVLVDVYGVGILLTGMSGIGKSETALELVKRGHRLIADDAVEIRQVAENILIGKAPELIRHLLEIRGVGIINVMTLFGAGAIRNDKKVTLVVKLEIWQQDKEYDRLGLDEETTKILDSDLTLMTIPVRPGRNLAVIIEVAAMNFRLKRMGYNAAQQFTNKLTQSMTEDMDELE